MNYETIFIVDPDVTTEAFDAIVSEVRKILSEKKTAISAEQNWGKKYLAYEIRKKREGVYYYIRFMSETSEVPNNLATFYRHNDSVMKFLTLKVEKKKTART